MGANDAAEQLEVAKEECLRLEHELASTRALLQSFAGDGIALTFTDDELLALATHLDTSLSVAKRSAWWNSTPDALKDAYEIVTTAATDLCNRARADRQRG